MRVTFGFKSHSGWAALVVLGERDGDLVVVERRRVGLVEHEWGKAPYHAAEEMKPQAARKLVERGVAGARRMAEKEMREAVAREKERGNELAACAVLVGTPMSEWTTDEILAVHFRMHKAEGILFQDVLVRAAGACGVKQVPILEKQLPEIAGKALGTSASALVKRIAALGKSVGPPWGKDQKDAALAALVALKGRPSPS